MGKREYHMPASQLTGRHTGVAEAHRQKEVECDPDGSETTPFLCLPPKTCHLENPLARPTPDSASTCMTQSTVAAGCVTAGAVFAEGSAMASSDECSYCFCIRGSRRCVAPKCVLPVSGCRPRYRTFSCCPSDYDCREYGVGSPLCQTSFPLTTLSANRHRIPIRLRKRNQKSPDYETMSRNTPPT